MTFKNYIISEYGDTEKMDKDQKTRLFMELYQELVSTLERDHQPTIQVGLQIVEKKCQPTQTTTKTS